MRPNKHKEQSDWKPNYKDPSRLVICIHCGKIYSLEGKETPIKLCKRCKGKERS